ncbi:hypothetical protein [Sporosarcina jiandibaonis]|uniref:hypothetical protein n=1 Tax=Sporosarcina jiandibaonis TaxID=2715535 RepID=UPI001553576A|nr:hypothetical protein [Sporosarcina jiandibaonis]
MELQTILAGPTLRRVDTNSVAIWIATSRSFDIDAAIFKINEKLSLPVRTATTSIRAGENLYIHLVEIYGFFPMDTLLGYDLYFHDEEDSYDLTSLGLISDNEEQSITYDDIPYPSFFIPANTTSNFLYASCRKFHGKGGDSLVAGDKMLWNAPRNLKKRPSSLFLLGDQIYADDVAEPLFSVIQSVVERLAFEKEDLTQLEPRLADHPFNQLLQKVNGRQFGMEQFCQFTSASMSNHLMTFGEYAVMYLLSWGPSLWETAYIPTFEEVVEKGNYHFIFPNDDTEIAKCKKRYNQQTEDLLQTIGNLHQVRRLLANVPTYMIFDDHDITDDWNLSYQWKENVSRSALGKHVIANGLCAYWAFQGWGNEPLRFEEAFLQSMEDHLDRFVAGTPAYEEWLERLWPFTHWHFVAPTSPAALFLNTRTMRSFDEAPQPVKVGWMFKENIQAPRLIGPEGWRSIAKSLSYSDWKKKDPLIIISPTPLYGMGLIESALHSYVYPLRAIGIPVHEMLDFEVWKYNGKGFSDFIRYIFKWQPSQCIILSGDVHYASAVKSRVESKNGAETDIVQFTSSPSNNMSFTGVWGFLMKTAIWWNAQKRKGKTIQRHCDDSFTILNEGCNGDSCPEWQEELSYLPTRKGTIVETRNNIGLLSIEKGAIENSLLQIKGEQLKEIQYKS